MFAAARAARPLAFLAGISAGTVFACVATSLALALACSAADARAEPPTPAPSAEPSSVRPAHAPPPGFEVGPAPGWVVEVDVPDDAGVASNLLHDGVADLLSDSQIRIGDGPKHVFNRYVSAVVEPSGVSTVGRIQIEFAATYQTLVIHWIRLVRGDHTKERLDPAKVRILQQEEDLELDLYYQNATALVLLDDVRVGDRVDYAYSVIGANPIFQGRYMDWLYLEWWFPFGRIHNRVVAPEDRPLHFALHDTDETPTIRPIEGDAGWLEYVWQADAVAGAVSEDGTPADFDPLAAHQVSEFETWGEVARWASDVFAAAGAPDDTVRAKADQIRAEHDAPADRIIAALRFVQDEVRYLGLEIGVNAYRPHAPGVTLERRFGDCKDKSSLLVALLAELGIEAHVALVNTELGAGVAEHHPTANVFDHAIVRVRFDGRDYWLDPTASYERGPLADEEWFDYGFALVVDPTGENLTVVEPDLAEPTATRVDHVYTSLDYEGPTRLEVRSVYRGDRADSFRAWVATQPTDSIERQYQNYYARDLPGIELAAPLEIVDDEVTNTIAMTERYRVPGFWEWDEERQRFQAEFIARELRDELSTPDTVQRTQPLATTHPIRTEVTTRIVAPERMRVRARQERIEGPAFVLDYGVERDGADVAIEYTYTSSADRVEAADMAAHLEAVNAAFSATRFQLGSSTSRFGSGGELGAGRHAVQTWLLPSAAAALATVACLFFGLPWLLLRRGVACIERGDAARATLWLRVASRAAPLTSLLARRAELALAVALGLWGRTDEALGRVAWLTRQSATRPGARAVRAAAWAWRAELVAAACAPADPRAEAAGVAADGRAEAFADRAVDLARELVGGHGARVRACALAARAGLRARRGALDAAARDLDEARAEERAAADDGRGFATLLRIIASTERAAARLACASGDRQAAVYATGVRAANWQRAATRHHPLAIEAQLDHAAALHAVGRTPDAWRAFDLACEQLGDAIDVESPLRARAGELRAAFTASE